MRTRTDRVFMAHRSVVQQRCPRAPIDPTTGEWRVDTDEISDYAVEQFLTVVYSGECQLLSVGSKIDTHTAQSTTVGSKQRSSLFSIISHINCFQEKHRTRCHSYSTWHN
jgi:hypothetical protein